MAVPTKMTITSYKSPNFSGEVGEYTVQINPEKYSQSYQIKYDSTGAIGTMNATLKFDQMPPQQLQFELIFDATGAILGTNSDLAAEIQKFQTVVYDYNGAIHEPYYLKVFWGKLVFGARLTAMQISYTLFRPDGSPLRARVNVTFSNYIDAQALAKQENRSSPDMTHLVTVKAGDTLPLLCQQIYENPNEYRAVAKANGLDHFRELKPGKQLVFPPVS